MRARRLTDRGSSIVEVPAHVSLRADLTARCEGCGGVRDLSVHGGDRAAAERDLGEFARYHRRHVPRRSERAAGGSDRLNALCHVNARLLARLSRQGEDPGTSRVG